MPTCQKATHFVRSSPEQHTRTSSARFHAPLCVSHPSLLRVVGLTVRREKRFLAKLLAKSFQLRCLAKIILPKTEATQRVTVKDVFRVCFKRRIDGQSTPFTRRRTPVKFHAALRPKGINNTCLSALHINTCPPVKKFVAIARFVPRARIPTPRRVRRLPNHGKRVCIHG